MMTSVALASGARPSLLTIYRADIPGCQTAHWRINGHSATIFIWTAEEWDRLDQRPDDAQYYPCGIWCALRLNP